MKRDLEEFYAIKNLVDYTGSKHSEVWRTRIRMASEQDKEEEQVSAPRPRPPPSFFSFLLISVFINQDDLKAMQIGLVV